MLVFALVIYAMVGAGVVIQLSDERFPSATLTEYLIGFFLWPVGAGYVLAQL